MEYLTIWFDKKTFGGKKCYDLFVFPSNASCLYKKPCVRLIVVDGISLGKQMVRKQPFP